MTLARILVMLTSMWIPQSAASPALTCQQWQECQQLALEAYARHDYEQFHDLAWRAVQTGPKRNAELMYLLARAQSLSGRPHDALIMLGRLAALEFTGDAATNDDFRAVRQLPQWAELTATIKPATPPPAIPATTAAPSTIPAPIATAPTIPTPTAAPPTIPTPIAAPAIAAPTPAAPTSPAPTVPPPTAAAPRTTEDAFRIPGIILGTAGLAYDRASARFVVVDAGLRKLVVIDERLKHGVDLVTSASAGFYDITGFEIDPTRGDLWVVSSEAVSPTPDRPPASALHRLQLLSGRSLQTIPCPVALQPCRFQDVGVTRDGGVMVLDTAGNRVLRWRPANHTLTPVVTLQLSAATSLAPAGDRIVYVAHQAGIARVDTSNGTVTALAGSGDLPMAGFERIRWARDSLVGVQRLPDGSQRAVRIRIVAGRAASIEIVDGDITSTDNPLATVSGDEFYVLIHPGSRNSGDVVIRRGRLR